MIGGLVLIRAVSGPDPRTGKPRDRGRHAAVARPAWPVGSVVAGQRRAVSLDSARGTATGTDSEASRALAADLAKVVGGDVRFDAPTRAMWSADASNYRRVPIGVVAPRDAADVEAAVAVCRAHDVPVLPRGAGTSIAGQAVNTAVVLDFTRHMNQDPRDRPRRADRPGRSPAWSATHLRDAARAARADVRPRPVHPQPLHARRDDRQQRVRLALGGVGQDRRQRRRARRAHLPRRAADSTPGRRPAARSREALRALARADRRTRPRRRSPTSPGASRATTSTSCCPRTGSTWPRRSSAPRARAP